MKKSTENKINTRALKNGFATLISVYVSTIFVAFQASQIAVGA